MKSNKFSNKAIGPWLELMKFRLSFSVALSAFAGYFMFRQGFEQAAWFLLLGVMLLASGVAVINQCQEHKTDRLMNRTKNRPIPCGSINAKLALAYGLGLIIIGALVLFLKNGFLVAILGLFNAFWYNLIYTPLKRKTAFAVVPGGVCGAIPPLMGWVAAGGYIWHPKILLLAFFFFVWQIPHFWLILLKYGKEYAAAGMPSITNLLNRDQLRGITFIWLLASGVSALFLPVFSMLTNQAFKVIIVILVAIYFVLGFWALYKSKSFVNYKLAFITVNLFLIFVIFTLIADKVFV